MQSLVKDIANPFLGIVTGNLDVSNYFGCKWPDVRNTCAGTRSWGARNRGGSFITASINFMIIAWGVFLLIKKVNKIEDLADGEDEPIVDTKPQTTNGRHLFTEICDEVRKDRK